MKTIFGGCAARHLRINSNRSSSCATTSSATCGRQGEALAKVLEIRVGPPGDALDRFEAAWNRVAEGRKISPLRVLTLQDLPSFTRALTPARWAAVEKLKSGGPCSIYELAKRLKRDYKNVHTDVTALTKLGLIDRNGNTEVGVAWDVVRAELRF
jgi:predicted transcriptional regulator